jgi:hypothetical protein
MKTLLHTAALLAGAAALALLSGSAAAQLSVDHQVGIPGFSPASYGGSGMGGARLMRAGYTPGDEYGARREADLTGGVNRELDRSIVLLRDFNRYLDQAIGRTVGKPEGGTQTAALTSPTITDASTPPSPTTKAPPVVTTPPKPPAPPTPPAPPVAFRLANLALRMHRLSSVIRMDASEGGWLMLGKITIVLATAAALTAGLTANAFAFSGGVSHVMTRPLPRVLSRLCQQIFRLLSALVTSLSITRAIPGALHQTQPLRLMDESRP